MSENIDWGTDAVETSRRILSASEEPFDWVAEITALWEPPQGYVCDNGQSDETTAVLMILCEGMLDEDEDDGWQLPAASRPSHRELFLECCAKIWDDNLKVAQSGPTTP